MRPAHLRTRALAPLLLLLTLAGCVVGPDYKGPPEVAPNSLARGSFRRAAGLPNAVPPARWWTALGDLELDRLEEAALSASPDVAAARARVLQARAGVRTAEANRLPTTGATAAYLRTKGLTSFIGGSEAAAAGQSQPLSFYTADFDATWEIDLFGGKARAVEGARARAEAESAALDGAAVSLEAEVASAYVTLRQQQARLDLARRGAVLDQRMLEVMRARRTGGTASDLDLATLERELQSDRAAVTPIAAEVTASLDRLAVLTGAEPGALDAALQPQAAIPDPPATVPVGDPAGLLRRRPDIREAERRLAQANAGIGQHTADLFPKVTLLGSFGYTAPGLSNLLQSSNASYALAPILQWTPFDFGRIRAQILSARGAYDEALASYRKTVLGALADAETAVARYGRERESLQNAVAAAAFARRAVALQGLRRSGGTAGDLEVLNAERDGLQAELGVADTRAELTTDFISLQKSLGLGWGA